MVYRINRDPIIDNDRVLRVDEIRITGNLQHAFQGINAGFATGRTGDTDAMDKIPFATDGNSTSVGSLSYAGGGAGQSSDTHGYDSVRDIQKFPFAITSGTSTDVGDRTVVPATTGSAGQSSSTHGYNCGGIINPTATTVNIIDKFPFASDVNSTDVGDLTVSTYGTAGHTSTTHGYSSAGQVTTSTTTASKNKFPFASDANAVTAPDVRSSPTPTIKLIGTSASSSITQGYLAGGTSPQVLGVQKFSFATDENSNQISGLSEARAYAAGFGSAEFGYAAGGLTPSPTPDRVTIDKYSYVSFANATDVGDLTSGGYGDAGTQD